MPEEMTPNMPTQPVVGEAPVAPVANPVSAPQNLDKSDAMTYPLGSQNTQPAAESTEAVVEDHRSILDRIMGLFSKGKKPEQPENSQTPQMPSAPETPTPPVQ